MTSRQAMIYLLWYGEREIAGVPPTEEEFAMFKEARESSKSMAGASTWKQMKARVRC